MPGPPAEFSPSELWEKLSEARPSEVIDFPRKDATGKPLGRVRVQVLRLEDHNAARMRAHEALKRQQSGMGGKALDASDFASPNVNETLADMTAVELLQMACLHEKSASSDPARPFYPFLFRDAADIRAKLSADEVVTLFNAYVLVQAKFGPYERNAGTKEDQDAWIARLAADPLVTVSMSLPQLVEVSTSAAARLCSISGILRSQWQDLPPTLASSLDSFCLDTSYSGRLPSEPPEDSASESPTDDDGADPELLGVPGDEPITAEQAARMAARLTGRG